jgi:hypothetical protein
MEKDKIVHKKLLDMAQKLLEWGYTVYIPEPTEISKYVGWINFTKDFKGYGSLVKNIGHTYPEDIVLDTCHKASRDCGTGFSLYGISKLTKEDAEDATKRVSRYRCEPIFYKDEDEFINDLWCKYKRIEPNGSETIVGG